MTFDALGVIVMISGPGDTKEEVAAIREAIATWNADHASDQKIVFVPKHYSTDAVPVYLQTDGQALINEQITDVSDVVIAVFKHRLGTPTPRDEHSGTVEEAKRRRSTGKVHVFFWDGPVPRSVLTDPKQKEQWDRLDGYRNTFHANASGMYANYASSEQLKEVVRKALWRDAKLILDRPDSMQPSPGAADQPIEAKVDGQGELDSRRLTKDLALIAESLGPIRFRSDFDEYLKGGADFNHLPIWFANDLRAARLRWSSDPRSVESSDLSDAWSNVRSTGEEFDTLLGQYLWVEDSGPGTPRNQEWLCIPREWAHAKRETVDEKLDTARLGFVEALDALYEVIHRHS